MQVHGGMGYNEETGAAQYLRDVRITTIYEGTTAIQANDFIGRKIARDKGAAIGLVLAEMREVAAACTVTGGEHFGRIGASLNTGANALASSVVWLLRTFPEMPGEAYASSVPLLRLAGIVFGGWQMARAALAAHRQPRAQGRCRTRRFLGKPRSTPRDFMPITYCRISRRHKRRIASSMVLRWHWQAASADI